MNSDISFDQNIDEGDQDSPIKTKTSINVIAIDEDDKNEDNNDIIGQDGFIATSYTIPTKATTSSEALYDTFDIETLGKLTLIKT